MKKDFDLYEFSGFLVPGVTALVGLAFLVPDWKKLLTKPEFSVGELGMFVIFAFVAGQLIQAVSSLLEPVLERLVGGRLKISASLGRSILVDTKRKKALDEALLEICGIDLDCDPSQLEDKRWEVLTPIMYSAVSHAKRAGRVDIFNANYALFRGLSTAFLFLAIISIFQIGFLHFHVWAFTIGACVCLFRMKRFSRYYAREVFIQFSQMVVAPPSGGNN